MVLLRALARNLVVLPVGRLLANLVLFPVVLVDPRGLGLWGLRRRLRRLGGPCGEAIVPAIVAPSGSIFSCSDGFGAALRKTFISSGGFAFWFGVSRVSKPGLGICGLGSSSLRCSSPHVTLSFGVCMAELFR